MILFADSSALVKLYSTEPGSAEVAELVARPDGSTVTVVSALARVEVPAALWRKHRMGELDSADAAVLVEQFEADWRGTGGNPPLFHAIAATTTMLDRAARLAGEYGLRAQDAVQLASAVMAREAVDGCTNLAAYDSALVDAAAVEGFRPAVARR